MPIKMGLRCLSCNQFLEADEIESHLLAYTDHIIQEVWYNDLILSDDIPSPSQDQLCILWAMDANNVRNQWLRLWGTVAPSNEKGGFFVPSEAVITKVCANREGGSGEWEVRICLNFQVDPIYVLQMSESEDAKFAIGQEVPVPQGSTIHCYHECADRSTNPVVWIELSWV